MDNRNQSTERAAQNQLDQIRPELLGVHQSANGSVLFSMDRVNKLLVPPAGVDRIQGVYKEAVVRHDPSKPLPPEQERLQPHWINAMTKLVGGYFRRLDKAAAVLLGDVWNPCAPDWSALRVTIARRAGQPHNDLDRLGLPALTQWAETAAKMDAAKEKTKRPVKRRRSNREPTTRQLEVVTVVNECKGNFAAAARRLGCNRKTVKQHFDAAMTKVGKLGAPLLKHKTTAIAHDLRGQVDVAGQDDGPATIGPRASVRRKAK